MPFNVPSFQDAGQVFDRFVYLGLLAWQTERIARHGDGWMIYPRGAHVQAQIIRDWRAGIEAVGGPMKPVMEPLYINLADDPTLRPNRSILDCASAYVSWPTTYGRVRR